jgi:hypothetical protein
MKHLSSQTQWARREANVALMHKRGYDATRASGMVGIST